MPLTLENRNGKIVAVDDQGNVQAIQLGDTVHDSVTSDSVDTEDLNSVIYQGETESVPDAIERASAGDTVVLRPGTFSLSSNLNIATNNITVIGSGRGTVIDGGTGGVPVVLTGTGITVRDLAVQTDAGAGNNLDAVVISDNNNLVMNIWVEESDRHGINIDAGTGSRVISIFCDSANIDGDDVRISADSNLIDDIVGTVSDVGTGNTVGDTV